MKTLTQLNVLMKNALKNITEEEVEDGREEAENNFQNGLCFARFGTGCLYITRLRVIVQLRDIKQYLFICFYAEQGGSNIKFLRVRPFK